MQFFLQHTVAGDKGTEYFGLDRVALHLQRGTDGMQRIGARKLSLQLIHRQVDIAVLAHAVQRI